MTATPAGTPASTTFTGSQASGATLHFNLPTGIAVGDYLLLSVDLAQFTGSTGNGSGPSGWTLLNGGVQGTASNRKMLLFGYPVTDATALAALSSTVAYTLATATTRVVAIAGRLTGIDLTDSPNVSALEFSASSASTVTFGSITAKDLTLWFLGTNSSSPTPNAVMTSIGGSLLLQAQSKDTGTAPNIADSQLGYFQGGTGATLSAVVPNHVSYGLSFKAAASNASPTAGFTTSVAGLAVTVTSTASDSDGTIASTDYDWGDGTTHGSSANGSHTYSVAGTYTITQTVTDNLGATGSTTHTFTCAAVGLPGIYRDSGGTNHPGTLFYWDGTSKKDLGYVKPVYRPMTVSQFLDPAYAPWIGLHRGGSYNYPEEVMRGYRACAGQGARALEVSVWQSSDGKFICSHDQNLSRTTGTSLDIPTSTAAAAKALNANASTASMNTGQASQPIIQLESLLDQFAATHVIIIECKAATSTIKTALLDLMDSYGTSGRPAAEIFIWKADALGAKSTYFDPATARGYHRWAYIFDASMAASFSALVTSGKADLIGMDFNSSDATLAPAIAACLANGVVPTGHIVPSTTVRDRLLGLGMRGLMMSNILAIPHPNL